MDEQKRPEVRVFLAEPNQRYDLTSAEEFGSIVYATTRVNPLDAKGTVASLKAGLEAAHFDPAHDMICLTGQAITVALFLAVVTRLTGTDGTIQTLMFDARLSKYSKRVVQVL